MRYLYLILFSLSFHFANSQEYKNLKVFVTDKFDSRASISVENLYYDPCIAADALRTSLVMNGFKVISEKVAREKIELKNSGQFDNNSFQQDVTLEKREYLNSVYLITLNYQNRANTGSCKNVMSAMSGQIVDLASDGEIVATFSFKQSNFEGKCPSDIMDALAIKLKVAKK
jgi:hypothetical protein